jgi:hypothetical protein
MRRLKKDGCAHSGKALGIPRGEGSRFLSQDEQGAHFASYHFHQQSPTSILADQHGNDHHRPFDD